MKRKRWDSKTKTKIVLEGLSGRLISEICKKYGIHQKQYYTWRDRLLSKATSNSPWDLANKSLYDLCSEHPNHKNDEEIIAKVWTIGRTYSAAIEDRRIIHLKIPSYDFYPKIVAPIIRKSNIDKEFSKLKDIKTVNDKNLKDILEVHQYVTDRFFKISGRRKRSLASKYLHFHFPDLFFLYDANAKNAIQKFSNISNRSKRFRKEDVNYRRFYVKCLKVRDHIIQECGDILKGKKLTPRRLDKLLLDLSSSKSRA